MRQAQQSNRNHNMRENILNLTCDHVQEQNRKREIRYSRILKSIHVFTSLKELRNESNYPSESVKAHQE